MIKTPLTLQDLRRKIYIKAKAEPHWRFWGLYVHVCKEETLAEAYRLAKKNKGAPGTDGVRRHPRRCHHPMAPKRAKDVPRARPVGPLIPRLR
ncbi:MAG: hypothetical protein V3V08_16690 [Nannocystaceae bacterium]